MNNQWCHPEHATVRRSVCSLDIELLVSFICVIYQECYLGNHHQLLLTLHVMSSYHLLLSYRQNTPMCLLASVPEKVKCCDCMHVSMIRTPPHREPLLGKSDHNLVFLCSEYKSLVQRHKKLTVKNDHRKLKTAFCVVMCLYTRKGRDDVTATTE